MNVCRAVLPRAGLGNRLFPWARCKLFALRTGTPMIETAWTQLTLGPILRGQRDWRWYTGQFQRDAGEIGGWRKRALLWGRASVEESRLASVSPADRALIEFQGMDGFFEPLAGSHREVAAALARIVRPDCLRRVELQPAAPIAIHVRMGDFRIPESPGELMRAGGLRTPLSWFVETLRELRARTGVATPAVVVSDGGAGELTELLKEPAVRRADTGSAVGDLLYLARARMLLGTGGSSFTAWAAYLGQIPVLTVPGQHLRWFHLDKASTALVADYEPGQPAPAGFESEMARWLPALTKPL